MHYFFFFPGFAFVVAFLGGDFFAAAFVFRFGEDVFADVLLFGVFPSAEGTLPFAFPFGDDVFLTSFSSSTYRSTVQFTLTETTSSPGFTSTTTSPLVAARLRMATASSLVDFGAPLVR